MHAVGGVTEKKHPSNLRFAPGARQLITVVQNVKKLIGITPTRRSVVLRFFSKLVFFPHVAHVRLFFDVWTEAHWAAMLVSRIHHGSTVVFSGPGL